MMLRLSCREATRLVLQSEDRRLGLTERLALRLHWGICTACLNFRRQQSAMRSMLDRWRAYRDE